MVGSKRIFLKREKKLEREKGGTKTHTLRSTEKVKAPLKKMRRKDKRVLLFWNHQ